jgi:hypothetical protein
LIAELKKNPRDDYLRIAGSPVGLTPKSVDSYRGYYEDLAINVEPEHYSMRVGEFVDLLESRIGTTMTGYKGGDYTIGPRTRVWISNYYEASGALVTGTRREDWGCTYITWVNDDD